MHVNPLHPLFAAELIGADCRQPTPELVALVEELMAEHAVLCIRDQNLTDDQHLALARAFGPLELPGAYQEGIARRVAYGLYDVSNLDMDGEIIDPESLRAKFAKGNELFHADSSFNHLPSKWSMLRGVIVTPERGETETIDMRAVHDALPQAMKDRIAGLEAEHSFFHSRRKAGAPLDMAEARRNPLFPYMHAVQPMVRTSANDRKALFVGAHAFAVVGMAPEEGQALIEELLAFASRPEFIYAHTWRQGDILIWDNRCTLHRGTEFDYAVHKRDLRRASINESGEDCFAIPADMQLHMVREPAKA
jgi:alpha-ketoglutarate-dependent 2,4-dichlorophenoxyacetate dioxygenase